MIYELPYRRLLILTEGHLGIFSSKTAFCVLRYRPSEVVGLVDSQQAGKSVETLLEGMAGVPVFGDVNEAMPLKPDALLIGIAPVGGDLPGPMRRHIVDALEQGVAVISGLHSLLGRDPELVELAERNNTRIHDIRDPGPIDRIARGLARGMGVKRVLTVGTDCSTGKMVTALELQRAAVRAGMDAASVATGQTGIVIEGWGIAVDHVLSDFAAGAAELLVEQVAEREICFIEGQGSIAHPGYSGVTLSLMHGTCPEAMIMCHCPGRKYFSEWDDCPITPITHQIDLYERVMAPLHPSKVVAVSLNTAQMTAGEADRAVRSIADETGLPTADPIRSGCNVLLDAIRQHLGL
ncbi:MAG: DUF1611 domain-containing protein [Planctomycetota bacterium]|jgi:uncharacterized NAD-dependent epimerase/dehydratase family protein